MRVDIESYVQGCDICISNKAQRYKPYGSMQALFVFTYKYKDLSIDFMTGLPKSQNCRWVEYDWILIIVDRLTKMVYYEPVFTILDTEQLANILIEALIKYHSLPDSIVTDWGWLFSSKFRSSLCFHLIIKRRLSNVFHLPTDGQIKRHKSTIESFLQEYFQFEQVDWVCWLSIVEFTYHNSWQISTIISPFEILLSCQLRMFYEDNCDPWSKPWAADKIAATLRDWMKE